MAMLNLKFSIAMTAETACGTSSPIAIQSRAAVLCSDRGGGAEFIKVLSRVKTLMNSAHSICFNIFNVVTPALLQDEA